MKRIKGQETRISVTGPQGLITSISNIQSFEFELQTEILSEGYLGETTERKDDIFKGVRGRMSGHMSSRDYLRFVEAAKLRSQMRDANAGLSKFSATCAFDFPEGGRARALLDDMFFGPLPVNSGGRDEYVEFTIEFECDDVRFFF